MTICILGATGRTGKHLLAEALQRGHHVRVIVRNAARITSGHEHLIVIEGDPRDREKLSEAMTGCTAVLSALNVSRKNDFPWSSLRSPADLLSSTMAQIISLSAETGVHRIIFTSAWGVGDSAQEIPSWFGWLIRNSNIGPAYADHARQEKLVAESGMQWTAVRPAALTNSSSMKPVRVSFQNNPRPHLFISRKMVAHFMLDCLEKGHYINRAPVISS